MGTTWYNNGCRDVVIVRFFEHADAADAKQTDPFGSESVGVRHVWGTTTRLPGRTGPVQGGDVRMSHIS